MAPAMASLLMVCSSVFLAPILGQRAGLPVQSKTTLGGFFAEPYVIAMRRGNFRLTAHVEQALKAIKADGTLEGIIAHWLSG